MELVREKAGEDFIKKDDEAVMRLPEATELIEALKISAKQCVIGAHVVNLYPEASAAFAKLFNASLNLRDNVQALRRPFFATELGRSELLFKSRNISDILTIVNGLPVDKLKLLLEGSISAEELPPVAATQTSPSAEELPPVAATQTSPSAIVVANPTSLASAKIANVPEKLQKISEQFIAFAEHMKIAAATLEKSIDAEEVGRVLRMSAECCMRAADDTHCHPQLEDAFAKLFASIATLRRKIRRTHPGCIKELKRYAFFFESTPSTVLTWLRLLSGTDVSSALSSAERMALVSFSEGILTGDDIPNNLLPSRELIAKARKMEVIPGLFKSIMPVGKNLKIRKAMIRAICAQGGSSAC
jgi:hypothetical protein